MVKVYGIEASTKEKEFSYTNLPPHSSNIKSHEIACNAEIFHLKENLI